MSDANVVQVTLPKIDRTKFFAKVKPLFNGRLVQSQVDGLNGMLDYWEEQWLPHNMDLGPNIRWLANILAETKWETASKMQPIEEYGRGNGHAYGLMDPDTHQVYYGRGLVQTTWKYNYQKWQDILGVPFVAQPNLMLDPRYAYAVAFDGMARGVFTGRRLGQYFSQDPKKDNPVGARAIINGSDHANDIAILHHGFLDSLAA